MLPPVLLLPSMPPPPSTCYKDIGRGADRSNGGGGCNQASKLVAPSFLRQASADVDPAREKPLSGCPSDYVWERERSRVD